LLAHTSNHSKDKYVVICTGKVSTVRYVSVGTNNSRKSCAHQKRKNKVEKEAGMKGEVYIQLVCREK